MVEFFMEDDLEMATYWGHLGINSLHGHCSGLSGQRVHGPGQSSLSQWSFTQKVVLKWLFVNDTGEEYCTSIVLISWDRTLSQ